MITIISPLKMQKFRIHLMQHIYLRLQVDHRDEFRSGPFIMKIEFSMEDMPNVMWGSGAQRTLGRKTFNLGYRQTFNAQPHIDIDWSYCRRKRVPASLPCVCAGFKSRTEASRNSPAATERGKSPAPTSAHATRFRYQEVAQVRGVVHSG